MVCVKICIDPVYEYVSRSFGSNNKTGISKAVNGKLGGRYVIIII